MFKKQQKLESELESIGLDKSKKYLFETAIAAGKADRKAVGEAMHKMETKDGSGKFFPGNNGVKVTQTMVDNLALLVEQKVTPEEQKPAAAPASPQANAK